MPAERVQHHAPVACNSERWRVICIGELENNVFDFAPAATRPVMYLSIRVGVSEHAEGVTRRRPARINLDREFLFGKILRLGEAKRFNKPKKTIAVVVGINGRELVGTRLERELSTWWLCWHY